MRAAAAILLLFLLFPSKGKSTGIYGMQRSRFAPPYTAEGNRTFADTWGKPGVYLIKNSTGQLVYVGFSTNNLARTMYRHFRKWDGRKSVYLGPGYTVRVILTTPAQAARLEKYLIKKMQPRDNDLIYESAEDTGKAEYEKAQDAEVYEPAPF